MKKLWLYLFPFSLVLVSWIDADSQTLGAAFNNHGPSLAGNTANSTATGEAVSDLLGWQFKVPITIVNTQNDDSLDDYQILVHLNTQALIAAGKMRSDGGDIRFTDGDGVTLLGYWIEDKVDTTAARIWVKVPHIPDSDSVTIYLYYGNPSASSLSNGDDTFDFFDDFDSASLDSLKWNVLTNQGAIELIDGYLRLYRPAGSIINLESDAALSGHKIIEFRQKILHSNYYASSVYYGGPSHYSAIGYSLYPGYESAIFTGSSKFPPRSVTVFQDSGDVITNPPVNEWFKEQFVVPSGNPFRSLNGETAEFATSFQGVSQGKVGIWTVASAALGMESHTDYLYVRSYASPEPVVNAGDEIEVVALSAPLLVSPANGAAGISVSPTLIWNLVDDATSYRLQVSPDSLFSTTVIDEVEIADTSRTINGLESNTTYYWRAKAANESAVSAWSNTRRFKTNSPDWKVFTTHNADLPDNRISVVMVEPSETVWVGTKQSGLAAFDGETWTIYDSSNSDLPSNSISSIAVDALENKWIGTHGGGLTKFDGQAWGTYDVSNSYLPSNDVYALAIEGNSIVWAGTDDGVVRFNGITWTVYQAANSALPSDKVRAIAIDEAGVRWIGTDSGLAKFDGLSWQVFTAANSPLPSDSIHAVSIDAGGRIWIGTSLGLAVFDDSSWTVHTHLNSGLPSDKVSAIAIDKQDGKWIGTDGGGFATLDGADWSVYDSSNSDLPSNTINSIAIGNNRKKWIATDGGLALFEPPLATPAAPTLLFPPNGESSISTMLTLGWIVSAHAQSYRLQVSTSETFSTIIFDDSTITARWKEVQALAPGTTYYWRVNATNENVASQWSAIWSFTTGSSSFDLIYDGGTPTGGIHEPLPNAGSILATRLTAPNQDAKIVSLSYYYVGDHANKDGSFIPVVYASSIAQGGVPASSPLFEGTSITPLQTGWIEVDVSSANLSLASRSSTEFFVGLKYNGDTEPQIGYSEVSNGRAWKFDAGTGEWTQLDAESPARPATLFIRARVDVLTGIEVVDTTLPKEYFLEQNFPNPFNPRTSIRYGLPRKSHVQIIIYDLLGQRTRTLLDAEQAAGRYQILWDGRDDRGRRVAGGTYFYMLKSGGMQQMKKMLLLP